MGNSGLHLALAALLASFGCAAAGELAIDVRNEAGEPVADAVITLVAADGAVSSKNGVPATLQLIDQSAEMFHPLVTVVRPGGAVGFSNSDRTQHHVYSFSKAKQFQLVLKPGEKSLPMTFDKTGVVAIGCNIHDSMVTYVVVTAEPLFAVTDETGRATLPAMPPGSYRASLWHPDLRPGVGPAQSIVAIDAGTHLTLRLAVTPTATRSPHVSHAY